jgi:hypothetical protein
MNNIFVFNTFLVISAKDPTKRVLIMEMELAESTLKDQITEGIDDEKFRQICY